MTITFSSRGNIAVEDEIDRYDFTLEADQLYRIRVNGSGSGAGTLDNTTLSLLDDEGAQVAVDFGSGPGNDSDLLYVPSTSEEFTATVTGFRAVGDYRIIVEEVKNTDISTVSVDQTSLISVRPQERLFLEVVGLRADTAYGFTLPNEFIENSTPIRAGIVDQSYARVSDIPSTLGGGSSTLEFRYDSGFALMPTPDSRYFLSIENTGEFNTITFPIFFEQIDTIFVAFTDNLVIALLPEPPSILQLPATNPAETQFSVGNAADEAVARVFNGGSLDSVFVVPDAFDRIIVGGVPATVAPSPSGTQLVGLGNDDIFLSGPGTDFYDGNDGIDTLSYANAQAGVSASLLKPTAFNTGGAGTDRMDDMEILIGSDFDDVLVGGQGVSNEILGGRGDDLIVGFAGPDELTGGPGDDTFMYNRLNFRDSLIGDGEDTILDFDSGNDIIDITRLGVGMEDVAISRGRIEVDVTGNGNPDFAINFANNALIASDDILV